MSEERDPSIKEVSPGCWKIDTGSGVILHTGDAGKDLIIEAIKEEMEKCKDLEYFYKHYWKVKKD